MLVASSHAYPGRVGLHRPGINSSSKLVLAALTAMNTDLFLGRFGGTLVLWVICQGTMTRDRMGPAVFRANPFPLYSIMLHHVVSFRQA